MRFLVPAVPVLFVTLATSLAAQPPAGEAKAPLPSETAPPRFAVGTSSVVLDVVVRDRKGGLVEDLKATDFDVREDGVRQALESFRVVGRPLAAQVANAVPAPAPPAAPLPPGSLSSGPNREGPAPLLAVILDRTTPAGRDLAGRATAAYLATAPPGQDLVGVYVVDLALHVVQPFTRDPALVQAALERAASYGHVAMASAGTRETVREQMDTMTYANAVLDKMQVGGASVVGQSGTTSRAEQAALAKALAETTVRLERRVELMERTQQGHATVTALRAVVETLARAPGRKTILLLSEGLALPAQVQPSFQALVARANEANVSFYALDLGGLRVQSPTEETARELRQAAESRLRSLQGDLATEGSLMRQLERSEDLLRLDPRSGLGQLTEETGGFLIRDTNDASASLRRIEEDMRFHYLLSYSPTNEKLDGRFRRVDVRVRRPKVAVQARKGYLASPRSPRVPIGD